MGVRCASLGPDLPNKHPAQNRVVTATRSQALQDHRSPMGLFSLEHSKAAYWADFVLHGLAAVCLAALLWLGTPPGVAWATLALLPLGLALWTLAEYLLHRFVLHGLRPFSGWHARHHQRPLALICGPTVLSASLLTSLVFLPLWLWRPLHQALALTLGVLLGYLAYGLVHHATHHARSATGLMRRRKRWHALHHHAPAGAGACFGVTTRLWDHAFGSVPALAKHAR